MNEYCQREGAKINKVKGWNDHLTNNFNGIAMFTRKDKWPNWYGMCEKMQRLSFAWLYLLFDPLPNCLTLTWLSVWFLFF